MMRVPKTKPRRLLDPKQRDGYRESDQDFVLNNIDACVWFLEHRDEIAEMAKQANRRKAKVQDFGDLRSKAPPLIHAACETAKTGNLLPILAAVGGVVHESNRFRPQREHPNADAIRRQIDEYGIDDGDEIP